MSFETDKVFRQEVRSFLENLFVDESKVQGQQNLQLAQFLFQSAYQNEQSNIARFQELGIALPEEYQTKNYGDFVNAAGDSSTMSLLGGMYGQAMEHNNLLNQSINQFYKGRATAENLTKLGAAEVGYYDYADEEGDPTSYLLNTVIDQPLDEYMVSPEELKALVRKGDISAEDYIDQTYMSGFTQGLRNQEDATAMLQADISLEKSMIELNSGKIALAATTNNQNKALIGNVITNNMLNMGFSEIMSLKGALTREGGAEQFTRVIEKLIDDNEYPLIQNELVGALNSYAEGMSEYSIYEGFNDMAANAYETYYGPNGILAIEKQAIINGTFGINRDPFAPLTTEETEKLRTLDEDYDTKMGLISQYASVGIPFNNEKVLQQAVLSRTIDSNIVDANNKIAMGQIDQMAGQSGLSRDAVYENIDWMPEDSYNNRMSTTISQDAALDAEAITGGLELPEFISEGWEEITALAEEERILSEGISSTRDIVTSNLSSFAADIPAVTQVLNEISLDKHVDLTNYVPNKEEIASIKEAIERDIGKWLDPATQKPWSSIPVLGLLAPEQGIQGVVGNAQWIAEQQARWKIFIDSWEKHQLLRGAGKQELSDKLKALNISQ